MAQDASELIPLKKSNESLRLVSFNVNGVKTLKNYYPWNERPGYDQALHFMKADIVAFQELKLQKSDIDSSIANPTDYESFITIPQFKKGYSGVGVFVRRPTEDDSELMKKALSVVKAEEGITGFLHLKGARKSYRDCVEDEAYEDQCIGGYPSIDDPIEARHLDGEGRCVIIELGIGLVIISVYCPANSGLTEEGEEFRLLFLQCLFERMRNLKALNKQVIIMGDINVSPDLIDSDETIAEGFEKGLIVKSTSADDFEKDNKQQVIRFKVSTEARKLVNRYLFDTSHMVPSDKSQKLCHDITRELQGRRLKMYSCWNTLKNNRPQNIGSRIDLFLGTEDVSKSAQASDVWPFLYGSDHCPIYLDIDLTSSCLKNMMERNQYSTKCNCRHMDAKNYYCIGSDRSIASFFKKPVRKSETIEDDNHGFKTKRQELMEKKPAEKVESSVHQHVTYVSRKNGQKSISSFFQVKRKQTVETNNKVTSKTEEAVTSSLFVQDSDSETDGEVTNSQKHRITAKEFTQLLKSCDFSTAPLCYHREPCVLRTVRKGNGKNIGKRFWCCARHTKNAEWSVSGGYSNKNKSKKDPGEDNCGYFQWE